ncbi:MAG TPA: hypothetical protein VGV16_03225 [Gammaproteobacteria bacterium]|nr:hypothetical protein [Gammaproteobacteria bacterium]
MSEQAENNQIVFLEGAWQALLQDEPRLFEKTLLADFVSSSLLDSLPDYTTVKHVVAECHSQEAVQESYIKSFLSLRKRWQELTTEARHAIVESSRQCGLQKNNSLKLSLLEDDEAALTIRWDTANRLYAGCRELAYKACQTAGLEMVQPRGRPHVGNFRGIVNQGQQILIALLRERINIDKTAVTLAVGHVTPVAKTKLRNNLAVAYLDALDGFRAALFHWLVCNVGAFASIELFKDVAPGEPLTPLQESVLKEHVETALRPFKQEYEALRVAVEDLSDPTIYEKVRRCFEDAPSVH